MVKDASLLRLGDDVLRRLASRELSPDDLARDAKGADAEGVEQLVRRLATGFADRSTLLEVAGSLGGPLELVPLLEATMARASELLHADRASVFIVDLERRELWSKVAQGMAAQEIRIPLDSGIAGHVATTGQPLNIEDAYEHPLFNREVDLQTGYRTRSVLCVPLRDDRNEVVGVISVINRRSGTFTDSDVSTLGSLASIIALRLRNAVLYEQVLARRREVETLLEVGSSLARILDLGQLIEVIMAKASEIMDAERSTLFLIDAERGELLSKVAGGLGSGEIRIPLGRGVAGHVAATGETLNITDAYLNPLFNREVDQQTGYRTRSILCMPIRSTSGEVVGVTQVVNKRSGLFTPSDERLLEAFSAQAAVAIDNAQLYERVRAMKAYLENIVESLTNGVLTVDPLGCVTTANASATRILGVSSAELVGKQSQPVFRGISEGLDHRLDKVMETGRAYLQYDVDCQTLAGREVSLNVNLVPLTDPDGHKLGAVAVLDDITAEKRVKSSLSRYMSKDVVDKLLSDENHPALGGIRQEVSILFSDIRSYTTLTEGADAHEVVGMLNEYFGYMVDVVFEHEGILDKFIGDAIMAVFGAPFSRPEVDPLNAVRAGLEMRRRLAVYNLLRKERGRPPIEIGIGISTGDVVCGNIGSEKRMEYTAIGDGVNLASRLEGATKQYGVNLMISEFTRERIGDGFLVRELDRMRVKGKTRPVTVYEVLGTDADELAPDQVARLARHEVAMKLYRARQWEDALVAFELACVAAPTDRCSQMYRERCRLLAKNPPAADWDGVWDLKDK